jgi:hypothetical protein
MLSGVASTLPNLAAKPKRRGQSLVELPLISPSIADRLAGVTLVDLSFAHR